MKKLTFESTRWTLGTYDGATIGWLIVNADGYDALSSTMTHVEDLTAFEVTGAPRGTIDVVVEDGVLVRDPVSSVPTADTSDATADGDQPAAVVFYDTTGSDSTRKLLAALAVPIVEPGFEGWEIDPAGGIADVADPEQIIESVVAGTNVTVDVTDPKRPIINADGGDVQPPSDPLVLGADSLWEADAARGLFMIPDRGPSRAHAVGGSGGLAAPVPAGAWSGLAAVGPFGTPMDNGWPTGDIHVTMWGRLLERAPSSAAWIEAGLTTIDDADDYLEPAMIADEDDVHMGMDYILNADAVEKSTQSSVDRSPGIYQTMHRLDWKRVASTGVVTFEYDGVLDHTASPVGAGTPLQAPPDGHLYRAGLQNWLWTRHVVRSGIDGTILYDANPAADGSDGAVSFDTGGVTWQSYGGQVLAPLTAPLLYASAGSATYPQGVIDDAAALDIGAGQSMTWLVDGALLGSPDPTVDSWWGRNVEGFGGGQAGWGFANLSGYALPSFSFAIGAAGDGFPTLLDLGDLPTGSERIIIRLDRATDLLEAWRGGEQVGSVDVSALGAVSPSAASRFDGYALVARYALWRRALTDDEIAYLTT